MNEKIRNNSVNLLFKAILGLKDEDECYKFFEDICTVHELQALAQRLEVCIMLQEGKTYIEIGKLTGASTATISRVNRSLNYGSDGYKLVLERLLKKEDENELI